MMKYYHDKDGSIVKFIEDPNELQDMAQGVRNKIL